jgi:hypothetical protein
MTCFLLYSDIFIILIISNLSSDAPLKTTPLIGFFDIFDIVNTLNKSNDEPMYLGANNGQEL